MRPANAGSEQTRSFPSTEVAIGRVPFILLVDDDEDHLSLFSLLLEKEGCEVLTARDAREALQILRVTRPDVIVCDVVMPGMTGVDLVSVLRNSPRYEDIPIIFMSASAWEAEEMVQDDEGPDMFCPKSLARKLLPKQIRFLLDR